MKPKTYKNEEGKIRIKNPMLNFKNIDGFKRSKLLEVDFSGRLADIKRKNKDHRFAKVDKRRKKIRDYAYKNRTVDWKILDGEGDAKPSLLTAVNPEKQKKENEKFD